MLLTFGAAVVFGLAVCNWLRYRDFLYPALIQSFVWALVLIFLRSYQLYFYEISDETIWLAVIGAIVFSIGCWLASFGHVPAKERRIALLNALPRPTTAMILLGIVIIAAPFMAKRAAELSRTSAADFFDVRLQLLRNGIVTSARAQEEGYGALNYTTSLSFFCCWVFLLRYLAEPSRKTKLLAIFTGFVALTFAILNIGRTYTFMLFIPCVAMLALLKSDKKFRSIVAGVLILLLVFAVWGVVLGMGGSVFQSVQDNATGMYDVFVFRVGAPLVALDIIRHQPLMPGPYTTRFFLAIYQRLVDHSTYVPPILQPMVPTPKDINVFTFYFPYLMDFGWWGGIIAQFLFGLWHGYLYRKTTEKYPSPAHLLLFGIFLFPLVMQFFYEQYVLLTSTWLQYGILIFLFLRAPRERFPLMAPAGPMMPAREANRAMSVTQA